MTKQEELRALALAATPGPWTFRQKWADHIDAEDGDICMLTDNLFTGLTRPLLDRRNNASYIAAMSMGVFRGEQGLATHLRLTSPPAKSPCAGYRGYCRSRTQ